MQSSELWKDIPGYEGIYQASTHGRIKSFVYSQSGRHKFLKQYIKTDTRRKNPISYSFVNLSRNRKAKGYAVHKLVALTFIPNPEGKKTVDHIDRDTLNNNVGNLRWATTQEQNKNKRRYAKFAGRKFTIDDINQMYEMSKTMRLTDIGKTYGINHSYVGIFLNYFHPLY